MAKKKKILAKVVAQNMLAEGICDLWLETPLAQEVRPGQFVGVYPANAAALLLPLAPTAGSKRPLSGH